MRWRIAGLLLAVVAIVGLPYIVTLSSARDTQLATDWVIRSNAVKSVTYELAYVTRDSEGAIYRMLAGDSNALTRQRAQFANQKVAGLLQELRAMTRGSPEQQVKGLQNQVEGKTQEKLGDLKEKIHDATK